jgi:hypothetical protein
MSIKSVSGIRRYAYLYVAADSAKGRCIALSDNLLGDAEEIFMKTEILSSIGYITFSKTQARANLKPLVIKRDLINKHYMKRG